MGTLNNSYPGYSYPIMVSDDAAYNSSAGPGGGIGFSFKQNSGGAYAQAGGIRGIKENTTDGNYASALTFYTRANGAGTVEQARIDSSGNIGINESAPDTKLHISHSNATEDVIKLEATPVTAATGERSRIIFNVTQSNGQAAKLGHIASHTLNGWGGELAFHTKPANSTPNNATNEVMRLHANGEVSKPYHPSFSAHKGGGAIQIADNASADIVFADEKFDNGSNYNTSNGRFTAPVAGKYFFGIQLYLGFSITAIRVMHSVFKKNGSVSQQCDLCGGTNSDGGTHFHPTAVASCMVELAANDYFTFNIGTHGFSGSGNTYLYAQSRFFGYLIG